jgi:hypothetical protein
MRAQEFLTENWGVSKEPIPLPIGDYLADGSDEFAPPGNYRSAEDLHDEVYDLIDAGVDPQVVNIDPRTVLATQDWLSNAGGDDPLFDEYPDRPVIYQKAGKLYILDGHHRTTAAWKAGRPIGVYLFSDQQQQNLDEIKLPKKHQHTEIIKHRVGDWIVYLDNHSVVRAMTRGIGPRMMADLIGSLAWIPDLENKVPVGGDFWIQDDRTNSSFYFKRLDIPSEPLAVRCETGVKDVPRAGRHTPVFKVNAYTQPEQPEHERAMKKAKLVNRFVGTNTMASTLARDIQKSNDPSVIRNPETQDSKRYDRAFRQSRPVDESRSSYREIEFVCANPDFCDATDPEQQRQLYQQLQKIPGVIPVYQDQSDYSAGQFSLSAIYQTAAQRRQIMAAARALGVAVDLVQPVDDDYIDRAVRGELEGQIQENFADGKVKGKSRPGRVKRAGASCNGSVTDLRARAKKTSGERAKMYHWCANMKSGNKKK